MLANVAAVVGFWGAGSADGPYGAVGALAVPLYWLAGERIGWWALPWPSITLVAGVALGHETGSDDNEFAWMNFAAGLVFCHTAATWGCLHRWREMRKRSVGAFPERPR